MKWLDRLLKSISEANQRQYGNGVPSCCQRPKRGPNNPGKGNN